MRKGRGKDGQNGIPHGNEGSGGAWKTGGIPMREINVALARLAECPPCKQATVGSSSVAA
jgi:hypothetical protein